MELRDKLRVLILPSWYPPDGGGFFRDHAEAINKGNYEVDVLVNRFLGLYAKGFYENIRSRKLMECNEGSLKVFRGGYIRWPGLDKKSVFGWAKRYEKIFKDYIGIRGKPDLIIAHSVIWAGYVAAGINKKYNIPYVLVEHRSRFAKDTEVTRKMIKEWHIPLITEGLNRAEKVVAVSEAINEKLISIFNEVRDKLINIPNIADTDFFSLPEEARSLKPFVFLAIGLLEDVKGFDILIKAFSGVNKKFPGRFRLRIGGSGSKKTELLKLAKDRGVKEEVILVGQLSRDDVKREMQMAGCFILPSRFEAFGVVLIEAMSTGCPVISTYSGGPEHIVNKNCGLLVQPEDTRALENAMIYLYNNYNKFHAHLIRHQTVEKYSSGIIRNKYHELIYRIVSERSVFK